MASYRLSSTSAVKLEDYEYGIKGRNETSLQKILADNPNTIINLPELGLADSEICLVYREYPTPSGPIDILVITENAEIIIVETKLIKNPESNRTVVAQAIDYVKAFSNETVDSLLGNISRKEMPKNTITEKIKNDDRFMALLAKNIEKGNFQVLIVGDVISPNILGMVESIQSAPHLAFTIYLVELNATVYDETYTIITPKIVANTLEIERSVIKIEITSGKGAPKIESETPSKESKGSKPMLSWDQYLSNVANKSFGKIIEDFKTRWVSEIDDSISMGQVGFSAGLKYGNKRTAIQFVYDRKIEIMSEKWREAYNIPEVFYREYKEELKKSPDIYDKYLIANKVMVRFDMIDAEILKIILDASLNLARKMKNAQ
ncbi:endonuclease NucS domain-containing protein [Candidatus Omnitrophota bacterium]